MMTQRFAAVDLGAGSGRVIVGSLDAGRWELAEAHRFPTPAVTVDGHLHWDVTALLAEISAGLRRAAAGGPLAGVGVDTWGVDYGRLAEGGKLLELPYAYRDGRTEGAPEAFFGAFPAERWYAETGLQVLPFNTIFQLASAAGDDWSGVETSLFLPDLLAYWLGGGRHTELTIASTSGLLDVTRRTWSEPILAHLRERYGVDPRFPPLVAPGTVVGDWEGTPVVAVAAHDTASAVAAVPAASGDFAYISSGTWSLVGLELDQPVITAESRAANFTNELGVDGTVRFLRNVMGLWVLAECRRVWAEQGLGADLGALLREAAVLPGLVTVVDMEDERLLPPGDMPGRIAGMARETGQPVPVDPPGVTRCILDSLALDYRRVIRLAGKLSGSAPGVIHIVGGGCQNRLLNQLTAEATGLPVIAGPAEATALGNVLVQARAVGALSTDLAGLREYARASSELTRYVPGHLPLSENQWLEAAARIVR